MVDGDWFRFDALQDFQLVRLSNFSDSFFRFFSRHLFTTHGKVFADDFVLKWGGRGRSEYCRNSFAEMGWCLLKGAE